MSARQEKPQQEHIAHPDNFRSSVPSYWRVEDVGPHEMILNIGPQHPATHGVLRLEVLTDGEVVKQVVPHIGYLHRCFEKHAESLPYAQIIPYVDRMDYVSAMNNEHAFVMGVEQMLGIEKDLPLRVEYIRVLVAELNRIASHFVFFGTYGLDLGAATPFLWMMRDREHILRLLEWVCGARMLYNYLWVGGLYYDLPVGFEERCGDFMRYLSKKLVNFERFLIENPIFIGRTAKIGVLPMEMAIDYGVSGPMLRATGLRFDLRRVDAYSVYPTLDFAIPIGAGKMGSLGDCWDRAWVRYMECVESVHIVEQCLTHLVTDCKRSPFFDPRERVPKRIQPKTQDLYARAENPKGELGFFFRANTTSQTPLRCKARSCCFSNLSVLPEITKNVPLPDLIAIVGSIDIVLGEVDR